MSTGTAMTHDAPKQSFIQSINEQWQKKYQNEQAWLESMDRPSIERTR